MGWKTAREYTLLWNAYLINREQVTWMELFYEIINCHDIFYK